MTGARAPGLAAPAHCSTRCSPTWHRSANQRVTNRFSANEREARQPQVQLRLLTARLAALRPDTDQPIRGRQTDFQPMRERVCQPQVQLRLLAAGLAALRPEDTSANQSATNRFSANEREGLASLRSSCACSLLDSLLSDLRQISPSEGDKRFSTNKRGLALPPPQVQLRLLTAGLAAFRPEDRSANQRATNRFSANEREGMAAPRSSCACSLLDSLLSDLKTDQPIKGRQTDLQPMTERTCQPQVQLRLLAAGLATLRPEADQPIRGRHTDFQPIRESVCGSGSAWCLVMDVTYNYTSILEIMSIIKIFNRFQGSIYSSFLFFLTRRHFLL